MLIYFIVFLIAYCIGLHVEGERGNIRILWAVVSFLPLALMAGLRAPEVGIDTGYYPLPFYHYSLNMPLPDMMARAGCEPGFSIFIWVVSRATRSFNAVLFLVQCLMIAPLVWAIDKFDVRKISLVVLVYACLVFPASLNIMRQSIAASFLLPALYFSLNRKWGRFFFVLLIAASFHLSALLGLLLVPVGLLGTMESARRTRYIGLFLSIGALAVASFLIFQTKILSFIAIFKESYSVALEEVGEGSFNTLVTVFPLYAGFLGFVAYRKHSESLEGPILLSLSTVLAIAGELSVLSVASPTLSRIGQLFLVFAPFTAAKIADNSSSRLSAVSLTAFCLLIFYWVYCHGDAAGIVPYSIGLVG